MNIVKLDARTYALMLREGAARLLKEKKTINDLNVFPIPDGDTGDNMYMTINAGAVAAVHFVEGGTSMGTSPSQANAKKPKSGSRRYDRSPICDAAARASQGMLLGARGNSGVILSRIFAGISNGLAGLDTATIKDFSKALSCGVEQAYAAVKTPVEGTILTVIREGVQNASGKNISQYMKSVVLQMRTSLKATPNLLPVLKEAGVVDSGGAGLLCIFEGMSEALDGKVTIPSYEDHDRDISPQKVDLDAFSSDTELLYGYCTEFLLRLQSRKVDLDSFDIKEIEDYLCSVGESVVVFRDGSIVKVHVHSKTPGDILSHCQRWGEFLTVKMENMTLQHSGVQIKDNFEIEKPAESEFTIKTKYAVVAVASGKGIVGAFKEAGVSYVIEGGQTMNPSAQSFIKAFDAVQAQTVFVLPNNSNILMTARQAASLYSKSDIRVIPTKTIGAGYVAAASLDFSLKSADEIEAALGEVISGVECGMVSKAVRDSYFDGLDIRKGDYIGINAGKICCNDPSRPILVQILAEKCGAASHEVVIIFYGSSVPAQEISLLEAALAKACPRTEFIIVDGGQEVYDYILIFN